jgi:hypothetical protein
LAAIICYILKGKCDRMTRSVNFVSESHHFVTFFLQKIADSGSQLVSPPTLLQPKYCRCKILGLRCFLQYILYCQRERVSFQVRRLTWRCVFCTSVLGSVWRLCARLFPTSPSKCCCEVPTPSATRATQITSYSSNLPFLLFEIHCLSSQFVNLTLKFVNLVWHHEFLEIFLGENSII